MDKESSLISQENKNLQEIDLKDEVFFTNPNPPSTITIDQTARSSFRSRFEGVGRGLKSFCSSQAFRRSVINPAKSVTAYGCFENDSSLRNCVVRKQEQEEQVEMYQPQKPEPRMVSKVLGALLTPHGTLISRMACQLIDRNLTIIEERRQQTDSKPPPEMFEQLIAEDVNASQEEIPQFEDIQ